MRFIIITLSLLIAQPCISRSVSEENSVVSVYTNQPPATEGSRTTGVYLIASSIADRITSPISKFFGYGSTENATTTKRPFHRIELVDDALETVTGMNVNPSNNEISRERDVEELSVEGKARKAVKRPEKITMFSEYLDKEKKVKKNETIDFAAQDRERLGFIDNFDGDVEAIVPKRREGGILYIFELIGSVIQLIWGGLVALITPRKERLDY